MGILIVALVAVARWASSDEIYRGVQAGGVELGGKTREQAREVFAERAPEAPSQVKLAGPGGLSPTIEIPGVRFDVEATVDRAYAVGRRGDLLEWLRASFGEVEVRPEVDYRTQSVRAEVESLAAQLDKQPHNASVSVTASGLEVTESREGYRLDVAATMNNVEKAIEDMSGRAEMSGRTLEPEISTAEAQQAAEKAQEAVSEPITLVAGEREWTLPATRISGTIRFTPEDGDLRVVLDPELEDALSSTLADLTVEPVNADYRVNGTEVSVIPGREGKSVDEEKLLGDISEGIFEGRHRYEVPLTTTTTKPRLTTAEARKLKPTTLLSDYRTNYEIVPGDTRTRNQNLRIASAGVTGTLVAPGEVFSMNDAVSGLDYEAAKVIINGKEVKTDGGGLCQVTSTLYNAANYAGLEILERHQHYSQLPYIRPGMDATVWFGFGGGDELDMRFRNTTDGYLLLREYVADDGYIYAEIWGRPNGIEVDMYSEPTYINEHQSGWVTYKEVRKNGKVIRDGVFQRSVYEPLTDIHGKPIPPTMVNIAPVDP